jgi:hypothetical protein
MSCGPFNFAAARNRRKRPQSQVRRSAAGADRSQYRAGGSRLDEPARADHEVSVKVCFVGPPHRSIHSGAASRLSAKNAIRRQSTLMWWRSAVSLSFFLCLATCRMRPSACDTRFQSYARGVLCSSALLLVPALGTSLQLLCCSPPFYLAE